MGINRSVREFENGLVQYMNGSNLPMEVKRLVLQSVLQQVQNQSLEIINIELMQEQQEQEKEGE